MSTAGPSTADATVVTIPAYASRTIHAVVDEPPVAAGPADSPSPERVPPLRQSACPPPPSCTGTLHTVLPGETLESIASSFGITLATLVEANPQLASAGQLICVPVTPAACCLVLVPTGAVTGNIAGTTYVAQQSPNLVTTLVAAINLPPPSSVGPYNSYQARFVRPSGSSFTFPLSLANPGSSQPVYAGGVSGALGPLSSATTILVFLGTAAGGAGPVVLQGSLENCH